MSRPGLGSASRSVGVILSESLPSVDLGFSICKSFISGRRRVEVPALVGGPGAGEQVRTQAQHQFSVPGGLAGDRARVVDRRAC